MREEFETYGKFPICFLDGIACGNEDSLLDLFLIFADKKLK